MIRAHFTLPGLYITQEKNTRSTKNTIPSYIVYSKELQKCKYNARKSLCKIMILKAFISGFRLNIIKYLFKIHRYTMFGNLQ
jgi:hypothetical protein